MENQKITGADNHIEGIIRILKEKKNELRAQMVNARSAQIAGLDRNINDLSLKIKLVKSIPEILSDSQEEIKQLKETIASLTSKEKPKSQTKSTDKKKSQSSSASKGE